MLSEVSCDKEDWSNYTENLAFDTKKKKNVLIYSNKKRLFYIVIIFYNIDVLFCIFDQINAALVSIRDYFCKH